MPSHTTRSHATKAFAAAVGGGSIYQPAAPAAHPLFLFLLSLVGCLRNNYACAAMDFGWRLGASNEHIPKWICKERATTPPPKRHAALRVALKLAWGFVAQSVEYHCGYTPSLAPRPRPI